MAVPLPQARSGRLRLHPGPSAPRADASWGEPRVAALARARGLRSLRPRGPWQAQARAQLQALPRPRARVLASAQALLLQQARPQAQAPRLLARAPHQMRPAVRARSEWAMPAQAPSAPSARQQATRPRLRAWAEASESRCALDAEQEAQWLRPRPWPRLPCQTGWPWRVRWPWHPRCLPQQPGPHLRLTAQPAAPALRCAPCGEALAAAPNDRPSRCP